MASDRKLIQRLSRRPALDWVFLTVALAVGIITRLVACIDSFPRSVPSLANEFLHFARISHGLVDTPQREPLFIWLIKGFAFINGHNPNPIDLRLMTALISIVAISLVFLFARRWVGLTGALVAALLYAAIPTMSETAVSGLRDDLIMAFALAFLDGCGQMMRGKITLARCALCGFGAGALMLTRLDTWMFVTVMFLAVVGWLIVKHWAAPRALGWLVLMPIIAGLLVAPYLASATSEFGTPFYRLDLDYRFYANLELAGKKAGMPTVAEMERNPWTGGPLTAGEYLFHDHTVSQLAQNVVRGFGDVYFLRHARFAYGAPKQKILWGAIWIIHVLGLIALMLTRRGRFILGAFFIFTAPAFFVAGLKWFDPRLLITTAVGFYLGIGAGVQWLLDRRVSRGLLPDASAVTKAGRD
jgi:hypothetical protein